MSNPSSFNQYSTGHAVRLACRDQRLTSQTAGLAPSYLQANLLVLPARYANDFRLLCARNPVPCPLIAESSQPGNFTHLRSHLAAPLPDTILDAEGQATGNSAARVLDIAEDIDLRHDFPKYRIYENGQALGEDFLDIEALWTDMHVGFLIGCSYSFESALAASGLTPRHQLQGRNVPMYRTNIPLCPAGVFTGATYVVSMRPYRMQDVERVREITRPYVATHGEPIAWGWHGAKQLGIEDITQIQWGEQSLRNDGSGQAFDQSEEGYVPVFWGCGVTPQNAVMMAGLEGTVMAHSPGHMIVLDVREDHVFSVPV
ncbi:hypothetical protein BD289DRAFT_484957 [Coniella lustricola]|uniref:DUF1445 domain-containing protein n=1 Tax=Coniella lustricola TaxID=2025994 RepID=A0A2T3A0C8_9PEZI|nr:hypothetical protein BD289DRAFT_484957 [Coniella lustricola]